MDTNSSKRNKTRKTVFYTGAFLVIGAGIGMTLGLLLFENSVLGSAIGIGAAMGLLIGAAIDAQGRHKIDPNEKEDA